MRHKGIKREKILNFGWIHLNFVCAVGVIGVERKRALLLHILGKETQQKVKALGNDGGRSPGKISRVKARLNLKKEVKPVFFKKARSVPYALQEAVNEELENGEKKVRQKEWSMPSGPHP